MERIYLPQAKEVGQRLTVSPEQMRYLTRVHRLGLGDEVAVFDGRRYEYRACLQQVDKRSVVVELTARLREEKPPRLQLRLAQGLPKQAKMELILQKGCELGLEGFIPFTSQHGVVRTQAGKMDGKLDRWRMVIEQACRQCRRIRLPQLDDVRQLDEILAMRQADCPVWLAYEGDRTAALLDCMQGPPPDKLILVIGPEGGFSVPEIERGRPGRGATRLVGTAHFAHRNGGNGAGRRNPGGLGRHGPDRRLFGKAGVT